MSDNQGPTESQVHVRPPRTELQRRRCRPTADRSTDLGRSSRDSKPCRSSRSARHPDRPAPTLDTSFSDIWEFAMQPEEGKPFTISSTDMRSSRTCLKQWRTSLILATLPSASTKLSVAVAKNLTSSTIAAYKEALDTRPSPPFSNVQLPFSAATQLKSQLPKCTVCA